MNEYTIVTEPTRKPYFTLLDREFNLVYAGHSKFGFIKAYIRMKLGLKPDAYYGLGVT